MKAPVEVPEPDSDADEVVEERGTKRSAGEAELEEGGEGKRGKVEEDDDVIVLD